MNARCKYPSDVAWEYYGGAGIEVCERWRFGTPNAFANFLEDMGERPEGMSIDRFDSTSDYAPGLCRWATATEQITNRRNLGNYGPKRKAT